jgi:glycosyltransferase involved in cell wall biosynthesis
LELKSDKHVINPLLQGHFTKKGLILLNKITKKRLGNFHIEWSIIANRKKFDLIYCINGELFLVPLLKRLGIIKLKLGILLYRIPKKTPFWKFHNLNQSSWILGCYDGINCLTKSLENDLIKKFKNKNIHIKYIPWATDNDIFKVDSRKSGNYFFCGGKTNRDHQVLIKAAKELPYINFIIIKHWTKDFPISSNIKIIDSKTEITDKAINYETLRKYYENCLGVCIPLHYDQNDTCGYTELLEAMAMGKPVIMTQSGCLNIDLEEENIGLYVNPNDQNDWQNAIKRIFNDQFKAKVMGQNAQKLQKKKYTIDENKKQTIKFLNNILKFR